MSEQDPKFTDEMVSAYLDGELSESEREYVERIVEGDPQYRRMLEELQALRDSLKSLPRFQLDDAFHQRVLERAVEQTKPRPSRATDTDGRHVWRRMTWVAGTMAAGLLLMLFLPGLYDRLVPEPLDEVGQVPRALSELSKEDPVATNAARDSVDEPPLATSLPRADELPIDNEPRQLASEGVKQRFNQRAESVEARGAAPKPFLQKGTPPGVVATSDAANIDAPTSDAPTSDAPTSDAAAGVAANGVAADHAVVDDAMTADAVSTDALTSFGRFDTDLDAIVYCTQASTESTDVAMRGLYRMSGGVAGELSFARWRAPTAAFGLESQPRFLIVKGSAEQIANSLSRIELTATQDLTRGLAVRESVSERFESGLPADLYTRKGDQDRLRRSSDLYIDLDAADTNPLVVDSIAKESDDYKKFLGFVAAKSLSSPTGSTSPDQSGVAMYALSPARGRQPTSFFYQPQPAPVAGAIPDPRALVDELKSITPRNEEGTLRVLLVLPPTEVATDPVPRPADAQPADAR